MPRTSDQTVIDLVASPDTSTKLQKPVETLVMLPRTHKLTALGRKMYNVLLFIAQSKLREMQSIPPATFLFEAPLPDILRVCAAENQNAEAKKYLAEMRQTEVVWNSPDQDSTLQQVAFVLLSESRISRKGKTNWVHWALPPTLYEALISPDRWANIDLIILSRLDSYAAIVLYEICTRYRNNPSKVTSRNSVDWWVTLLSPTPPPIDPSTGQPKLREWRKFKNDYIWKAIEEINTKTDLKIELMEGKEGRAITSAQFHVEIQRANIKSIEKTQREISQIAAAATTSVQPETLKLAELVGVPGDVINELTNFHGEDRVRESLHQLEQRQQQTSLPLVRKPTGYLKTLLDNGGMVVAGELIEKKAEQTREEREETEAFIQTVSEGEEERQKQRTALREEVYQRLMNMSPEELQNWLDRYREHLKVTNMLTPSNIRRLNPTNWNTGMIKHGLINFYGLHQYGEENWPSAIPQA